MPTTLRPTGTRLTIRRDPSETKTPGGLFIVENAQEKPIEGTVLAIGPMVNQKLNSNGDPLRVYYDLQPGQKVLFGKYAGQEVAVDGEPVLILQEDDVLAILEREETKPLTVSDLQTEEQSATA